MVTVSRLEFRPRAKIEHEHSDGLPNDEKGDQTEEDGESKGITHLRARTVGSSKLQTYKKRAVHFFISTKNQYCLSQEPYFDSLDQKPPCVQCIVA